VDKHEQGTGSGSCRWIIFKGSRSFPLGMRSLGRSLSFLKIVWAARNNEKEIYWKKNRQLLAGGFSFF